MNFGKYMKKREIIIIGVILLVAVGALFFLRLSDQEDVKRYVKITVDGEVYDTILLTDDVDMAFSIVTDLGENHVVIKDGAVNVDWADCKNQVCVNTKEATHLHDAIICLPHKLVIEIVED